MRHTYGVLCAMGTGLVLAYLCPQLLKAETSRCRLGLALRTSWPTTTSASLSRLEFVYYIFVEIRNYKYFWGKLEWIRNCYKYSKDMCMSEKTTDLRRSRAPVSCP